MPSEQSATLLSREQLRVILQSVADGITVQDPSGRLICANKAADPADGYPSVATLLTAPSSEFESSFTVLDAQGRRLPSADLPGQKVLAGEPEAEAILGVRENATGAERWASVTATPVHDAGGTLQFAVNIFHDITERKKTETALDERACLATLNTDVAHALTGSTSMLPLPASGRSTPPTTCSSYGRVPGSIRTSTAPTAAYPWAASKLA